MMLVLSSKYLYDNFEEKEALFKMIAKDIIVMNELKSMSLIDKVKGEALYIADYLDYLTQLDNYSIGSDRYLFSYFSDNEELLNEIINGRKVYGVKIDTMDSENGGFVHKVYMNNKKLGELESDIGAVCSITADKTLILRDRVGTLSLELNLTDKINRYIDILNNIECFYNEKELKLIQYGIVSVVSKDDNITLDDFWRCS